MKEKKDATFFNNQNRDHCVAILTRTEGLSGLEEIGNYELRWHDWEGNNAHFFMPNDIDQLILILRAAYDINPNRFSFDSNLYVKDIKYNKDINNYDEKAKFNPNCRIFKRRLCIEFNLSKQNLIELLKKEHPPTKTWHGKVILDSEKSWESFIKIEVERDQQLMDSFSFARFDLYDSELDKWVTYNDLSPVKESDCLCRLF